MKKSSKTSNYSSLERSGWSRISSPKPLTGTRSTVTSRIYLTCPIRLILDSTARPVSSLGSVLCYYVIDKTTCTTEHSTTAVFIQTPHMLMLPLPTDSRLVVRPQYAGARPQSRVVALGSCSHILCLVCRTRRERQTI